MRLDQLETPVPVVDLDVLERNLDNLARFTTDAGIGLRPHTKTHKSPRIGAEQIRRGALGLTCATPREAEVMADVADDILLAYPPLGDAKLRRLMALPRNVKLMVGLDSATAIEGLAAAARAAERPVRVLVELDLGMKRVGVGTVEEAIALAKLVRDRDPLIYAGVAFYPGHLRLPTAQQREGIAAVAAALGQWLQALDRAGLRPSVVSGGSTPTIYQTGEMPGVTEIRPGTYVYNDREIVSIGDVAREDCALTVLATVVSTAVAGQAVVDAGTKALGREPLRVGAGVGFGELLDRPEVTVKGMSEEHGILDLSRTDWRPQVGERVRILPNHVCIVTHLNDFVYGIRDGGVESTWPVTARGRGPAAPL